MTCRLDAIVHTMVQQDVEVGAGTASTIYFHTHDLENNG